MRVPLGKCDPHTVDKSAAAAHNARISKRPLDDRFRLPADAKFDHLGE
jgi:hypothetical protein